MCWLRCLADFGVQAYNRLYAELLDTLEEQLQVWIVFILFFLVFNQLTFLGSTLLFFL